MFIRSWEAIFPEETLFSSDHIIGQLTITNWLIDQIFEIELGRGKGLDRHEMGRNEVFRSKFATMGSGEPIFSRKKFHFFVSFFE